MNAADERGPARPGPAKRETDSASRPAPRRAGPAPVRRVTSDDLMGANGQMIIRHAGADYRLRVTSKGKLILTK